MKYSLQYWKEAYSPPKRELRSNSRNKQPLEILAIHWLLSETFSTWPFYQVCTQLNSFPLGKQRQCSCESVFELIRLQLKLYAAIVAVTVRHAVKLNLSFSWHSSVEMVSNEIKHLHIYYTYLYSCINREIDDFLFAFAYLHWHWRLAASSWNCRKWFHIF